MNHARRERWGAFRRLQPGTLVACLLLVLGAESSAPAALVGQRCVVVEFYVQLQQPADASAVTVAKERLGSRAGVLLAVRDITDSSSNRERYDKLRAHYRLSDRTPLVYGLNQTLVGFDDRAAFTRGLDELLTMEVFVRRGCPRCARAKSYLESFHETYPGIRIVYRDLVTERSAVTEMNRLVAKHRAAAASVPVFHFCDRLIIGFTNPTLTGDRITGALQHWTVACPANKTSALLRPQRDQTAKVSSFPFGFRDSAIGWSTPLAVLATLVVAEPDGQAVDAIHDSAEGPALLPLPPETTDSSLNDELPIGPEPLGVDATPHDDGTVLSHPGRASNSSVPRSIVLPVFGEIDVDRVSLTTLTLAIGLVDGFNPCAMWVLLFLLSLLVNLKDRRKIIAIAGTFVLISGVAYFAFMAAWLNVFTWIGYLRPVQIALGMTAILIGAVHIKDFFAFHRGLTLSIPESAKPTIYAQTRKIISADNLLGAMTAAIALAVMVNFVELLCTAGLPALYTEILSARGVSTLGKYGYLVLYNVAYMFDDALMVAIVVVTLGKHKMQENQGRWLKLVSGGVIAALGLVMIVRPEWLV